MKFHFHCGLLERLIEVQGMHSINKLKCTLISVFTLFCSMSSNAATIEMTAVFRPDPSKPMHNVFQNTTPQSGHCKDHPNYCEEGVFSIGVPIRFRSVAPFLPMHDERQGPMFRVPSSWKELNVTHDVTGETETVRMRVVGIGGAYTVKLPFPEGMWNRPWGYAPAPCLHGGVAYASPYFYAFFWKVPPNAGTCAKQAIQLIPETYGFAYQDLTFSYELETPQPLKMSSGTYRGVLSYSVGPHKEFDMGDIMLPDDDVIQLDFALNVEHTLKVDIPPGGNSVVLEPKGGWQSWLQAGRKPVRLFRDQTFNISASSRFKMHLMCGHSTVYDQCGLYSIEARRMVGIYVSVSLPNGLTDMAGQPVRQMRLLPGEANALQFQPGFYVDRAPGVLHFEMPPQRVEEMLRPPVGQRYRGSVTVIWDSDV
ncbi:hypothetical protein [Pseudomonas sp. Pseusp16]|uniref:hypothetical protein n=1 Tax=Pseudomonas sp. Pseusp16 TaxID=3243021 RepID=UPI0039B4C049